MTIRQTVAGLVRNISYEVMPLRNAYDAVLADVPVSVPLTVTVTEAKGIDATLDLTERLMAQGYTVTPHLPARQFVDRGHVGDVVSRMRSAGVWSVFVIGGDAPRPVGEFQDAYSLLQAMEAHGHPFEIGIAGYPEGHAAIPQQAVDLAFKRKAPMAARAVTQICFDAATTASWAAAVDLPVHVGVPGPVNRQKLVRISAGLGLGQSARFVRKQHNLVWRLLLPGGYRPTRLVKRLGTALSRMDTNVHGMHIFTFNELHETERWRQELLALVSGADGRA